MLFERLNRVPLRTRFDAKSYKQGLKRGKTEVENAAGKSACIKKSRSDKSGFYSMLEYFDCKRQRKSQFVLVT